MGIFLEKLALSGYCSYDNDLEKNSLVFDRVNVIVGANGAGKSNLISFLEMVAYMMTGGFRRYVAIHGGAQSLMYFGRKCTKQINGFIACKNEGGNVQDEYSFSLEANASGQLFFSREEMQYWDKENYERPYIQDLGVGHSESNMLASTKDPVKIFRNYLKQIRVFHFNDTSMAARIRNGGSAADNAYLRSDGGNIAAFLYRMREENLKHYQRVQRYVKTVLPQFQDFYLEEDIGGNIALRWQIAGDEGILGTNQLSDGSLRFIALTTLLLQPADHAPATIILDEPEIGLHPYALAILADEVRMASKISQIIISTQSPLFLNYFKPEEIITAEYDADKQSSRLRRHTQEELAEWLNEYSLGELWEKNVLGGMPL
ncbi:AAA family ATPase [Selenomonas sputigena]|uniref:AAA family ATPase n=1 Tax=Selenomonas sputigena TaxID=69823 RepID=UPI0028EC1A10|nr:AAA family ATPase [Selenomonas sputigena]